MAIACAEAPQAPVINSCFKIAAFMCFFSVALGIIEMPIRILVGLQKSATLNFIVDTPLTIVSFVISIYIFLQLKRFLVERHNLHNISNLINFIILDYIYLNAVGFILSIFQMIVQDPYAGMLFFWILIIPGALFLGIISIIIGIRILEVKELTSGLYRTYAILSIVAPACGFTIILIPIAILLSMASDVVLGFIFLKESEAEPEIEFV